MAQLQFLTRLLNTQDSSLILNNNINVDFFSDYKDEFLFITDHLSKYGNVPDMYTFMGKFPHFDVIEVRESSDYLVDALYEDRNTRKTVSIVNKIAKCVNEGRNKDAIQILQTSADEMINTSHMNTINIITDNERYDAYIERCNDFTKYYVKTGLTELDDIIGGWDRQEELATIVARPNVGKSWIMEYFAKEAARQGLRVGIYSGEMTVRKVGYRFDTLDGHISNTALTKGRVDIQNEYKKYRDNKMQTNEVVMVLTPEMLGGPATVSNLRAFIEKDRLDILFVDQHSLLEDERHGRGPVEKAANISRDLKNLQVLKKIPIIAVSQQNRSSIENGVGLEHVAQSDRISQDSTIVIFCEKKQEDSLTINLVKSRDSANNKELTYAVDFNIGRLTYMPAEGDAVGGVSSEGTSPEALQNKYGYDDGEDFY